MKKTNFLLLILITCCTIAFTVHTSKSNLLFEEQYENVGTIKQSLLKPEQFQKTQKGVWIPLDGRILGTDTELYTLLKEANDLNILQDGRLPNSLRKFIRSSNYLGNGSDPDKSRMVGSTQNHAFQTHQHGFGGNFLSGDGTQLWDLYGTKNIDIQWAAKVNNSDAKRSNKLSLTSAVGDKEETRPINLSLYTYIKIAK